MSHSYVPRTPGTEDLLFALPGNFVLCAFLNLSLVSPCLAPPQTHLFLNRHVLLFGPTFPHCFASQLNTTFSEKTDNSAMKDPLFYAPIMLSIFASLS